MGGSPFFQAAGFLQDQNYRNALLQLNQRNQAMKMQQMQLQLANERRQQQAQALIGGQLAGALGGAAQRPATGVPFGGMGAPQPQQGAPAALSLPQQPQAQPQMAAGGALPLAQLQQQVLSLEGNKDYAIGSAGELGPGQIKPATGAMYGFKPDQLYGDSGRQASGTIVDDLYRKSGGDPAATLVGYNAGPGAMRKFQSSGDNPNSVKLAPPYRRAVLNDLTEDQQGQASNIAITAAGRMPPPMVGQAPPSVIQRLVEQVAGASADDDVKGAALMQLLPLMSQDGQRQFQQMYEMLNLSEREQDRAASLQERQGEFKEREADRAAQMAQTKELAAERMQQGEERLGQGQERIGLSQQKADTDPARVALQTYLREHPGATAEEIQAFIQRGRSARSGPAMAAQRYLEEHPNATSDDIRNFVAQTAAQTSSTRAFDVGTQGNTVRSLNVAIDHLNVLQDAANALQGKDMRTFNRIGNAIAAELGYPAPTDFNATKGIVKDEVVKAILGGVGALGDRQEVERTIDAANSPEQLAGVIKRYEQLMGGQMQGLRQQFITSGAGGEDEFEKKLLPRTVNALQRARGASEQSQGQPAAGGDVVPVPPAFAKDPDGTSYQKDDGTWVKKGDRLVKTPGAVSTDQ